MPIVDDFEAENICDGMFSVVKNPYFLIGFSLRNLLRGMGWVHASLSMLHSLSLFAVGKNLGGSPLVIVIDSHVVLFGSQVFYEVYLLQVF